MEAVHRLALATLLGFALAAAGAARAQDITLEPGASCTNSSCHEDMATAGVVHPAAADGDSCTSCHFPGDDETVHEFELADEPPALCFMCHEDMTEGRETIHPPVADGMCTMCHNPHQSDNPRMLEMPLAELCVMCHADAPFTGDEVTHGPVAKGQCIQCHDPHAGDHPRMLKAEEPDLCFRCHNRTQKDPQGRPLPPTRAAFNNDALSQHPPFAAGTCTMCHMPHAGPNYRLLFAPYPETFYAPFSEDAYVCFQCHDSEAFTEPRTMDATGFRNGNLNLHYRHVNREKGRTCRACHDQHAGAYPHVIHDRVPFGKRYINLENVEFTETGGTCGPTCHPVVKYDRFDPQQPTFRVSRREGSDATAEELEAAKAAAE